MPILIIDDDLVCRKYLATALARFGQVTHVATGAEGVEAVEWALSIQQPFRLIMLDILMPDMDGHAVLAEIRKRETTRSRSPSPPAVIVMTSSLGDGRNVGKAFGARCDGYLTKPIELDKLFAFLAEHGFVAE